MWQWKFSVFEKGYLSHVQKLKKLSQICGYSSKKQLICIIAGELEDKTTLILPTLEVIKQVEMTEKTSEKETHEEEETTEIFSDQSSTLQNELEQMSKALEVRQ